MTVPPHVPSTRRRIHSRAVAHALAAIESALRTGGPRRVAPLARRAGLSLPHFCRRFKAETGCTATAFFQRRRIEGACLHLLAGEQRASEIAARLGFYDGAHLSRQFKLMTGTTPTAFRQI